MSAAQGPTTSQLKGAYFGALVADSLCLGSHYEYDAIKIKKAYGGDIDRFMAPGSMYTYYPYRQFHTAQVHYVRI
jgi:hypothetical protein